MAKLDINLETFQHEIGRPELANAA